MEYLRGVLRQAQAGKEAAELAAKYKAQNEILLTETRYDAAGNVIYHIDNTQAVRERWRKEEARKRLGTK